jgi:N-acetylmuramoyl-L-alanine amidase
MENSPSRIIWHHTADSSNGFQSGKVNLYHKSKSFPISSLGFYGGYHYLVEKDGSIFQYRKETDEGAHTIGFNLSSIGVCMSGNFDIEYPTAAQRSAFAALLSGIMDRWKIPVGNIDPHRAYANKSCPGQLLPDNWAVFAVAPLRLSWIRQQLLKILALLRI